MHTKQKMTLGIASVLCASALIGGSVGLVKVDAAGKQTSYNLGTEISKIQSIDTMLTDSTFHFYGAISWMGPYEQKEYSALDGSPEASVANWSKIETSANSSVTPSGTNVGGNTLFSYTGTHTVGTVLGGENDRTWAIGWEAPATGTVIIPEATLKILGFNGANLQMGFSKGTRTYINPTDTSLNWETYTSNYDAEYTIEEQSFSVAEGEMIYINLYAAKNSDSVSDDVERTVQFTYNPTFVLEETPDHMHVYNHVQKLTFDGDALVNNVQITDNDSTTYPFSYLYRSTGGSDAGFTGQESASGVMEMARASASIDPSQKRLYAGETYSGFMTTGQIVTIARTPDPMNVILGFTAPYDGALTISDIAFKYNSYPNATNNYTQYGNNVGEAFKGYVFRVLLNGKTVWPVEGGWDNSLAKLYETATDGYAVGDLIASQSTNNIENILVRQYDEVYFEITRADVNTTEACDVLDFNPTFTIDSSADMSGYTSYVTAAEYFDVTNTNNETTQVSYWGVDITNGLYNNAQYNVMSAVDYSALAYTSDILDDDAAEIGWNYFRPTTKEDAAISYLASKSGNVTISAESLFRGANLTLWEYYDIVSKGNLLETDGIRIRIEINGERAWPTNNAWKTYNPHSGNNGAFTWEDVTLGVEEGDRVTVRVNCGESDLYDGLNFNPVFEFVETETPMTNPTITVEDPVDDGNSGSTDGNGSDNSGNSNNSGNTGDSGDDPREPVGGCNGCNGSISGGLGLVAVGLGVAVISLFRKRKE